MSPATSYLARMTFPVPSPLPLAASPKELRPRCLYSAHAPSLGPHPTATAGSASRTLHLPVPDWKSSPSSGPRLTVTTVQRNREETLAEQPWTQYPSLQGILTGQDHEAVVTTVCYVEWLRARLRSLRSFSLPHRHPGWTTFSKT